MAGSYNHCVRHQDRDGHGELLAPKDLLGMLECHSGDVYEAIEEFYGMVWYLASEFSEHISDNYGPVVPPAVLVEEARKNYFEGLRRSPGIEARLPEED